MRISDWSLDVCSSDLHPLYRTALRSLPEGAPFPTTKEEVLRRFIAAHEQEARRAAALQAVALGFQQDYLDDLAVFATTTAHTAISDSNARKSVANTARVLVADEIGRASCRGRVCPYV